MTGIASLSPPTFDKSTFRTSLGCRSLRTCHPLRFGLASPLGKHASSSPIEARKWRPAKMPHLTRSGICTCLPPEGGFDSPCPSRDVGLQFCVLATSVTDIAES